MAELLSSHRQPSRAPFLLLTALVLIAVAGTLFAVFYKHENHPQIEASVTRVLAFPLRAATGKVAGKGDPESSDDVVYIALALRIHDRSDVPLFVKDITASATLQDGTDAAGRRIGAQDRARLQAIAPGVVALMQQAAAEPLDPEEKIAPNSTVEGYTVFLYSMPLSAWNSRQSASVRLDFYHQDSITLAVPKE